jgi:hypothetical protein
MKTTLDIADDVLTAAEERARQDNLTVSEVITDIARQALLDAPGKSLENERVFYGFRPFPKRGVVITQEMVNRLIEEEGI